MTESPDIFDLPKKVSLLINLFVTKYGIEPNVLFLGDKEAMAFYRFIRDSCFFTKNSVSLFNHEDFTFMGLKVKVLKNEESSELINVGLLS